MTVVRTIHHPPEFTMNLVFFLQIACLFAGGARLDDETLALVAVAVLHQHKKLKNKKIRRKRTVWVSDINAARLLNGEFHHLMADLRKSAGTSNDEFFRYFQMKEEDFDRLHKMLKKKLAKKDTNYRKSIGSEERLALTLR